MIIYFKRRKSSGFCLKNIFFISLLSFLISNAKAQHDTVKVMTYNVLNYGFPSTNNCPLLLTANKHNYLRTILRYENPDILGLVKMSASPASFTTDTIVHTVLDSICNGCYGHSDFTNVSGYTKEDMLYFKITKFGYLGTTTIYADDPDISDINLHRLYYKSPSLSETHDTTFLNIILVHDKSGSNNANQRATEIEGAMAWLESHITAPGNYIFMGDFNVQSASEDCFQAMINSSNSNTTFFDPVNQLGNWANHPENFANYITEDTRMNDPGDCGADGGMSTRFIHILCTQPLMDGSDSIQYINDSYNVIGQDGNHIDIAINDLPLNTSVPADELDALYYMSNHLPVSLELDIRYQPSTTKVENHQQPTISIAPNPVKNKIFVTSNDLSDKNLQISIIDIYGSLIYKNQVYCTNNLLNEGIDLSGFIPGVYSIEVAGKQTFKRSKFVVE